MPRSRTLVPLAILAGGALIAVAVFFATPRSNSTGGTPSLVRPVGAIDHILGNPAAPVKIIAYVDFDSPYSKTFDTTLRQIVANNTKGSVALVYREFPLTDLHPNARAHAEAAECAAVAGGNDAFWAFTKQLFAAQPANPSTYGTYARAAAVPTTAFASCYADASTMVSPHIAADEKDAQTVGANGTPYTLMIVSGKAPTVMVGAYPYDAVQALIDKVLAS